MGVTGEGFSRDYALDQRGSGQPHKGVQALASLCSVSYLSTREKDSDRRGSGQTHRGEEASECVYFTCCCLAQELLEKALQSIVRQLREGQNSPRDVHRLQQQQASVEKELSRVTQELAEASKVR